MIRETKKKRAGQSTVELALILPILVGMLAVIVHVVRLSNTANKQTVQIYADRLEKFDHGNGMIFDPVTQVYVPAGSYGELIPPEGVFPLEDIANVIVDFLARTALSELLSKIQIFDDATYLGAFGEGFTHSMVTSIADSLLANGSLESISLDTLESAVWAGLTSSITSEQATKDFQGSSSSSSSARELLGSVAQSSIKGFTQGEGDFAGLATGAVSGAFASDTATGWIEQGSGAEQIFKGAGLGAIQSGATGLASGNFSAKTVLVGAATGAMSTGAFAEALPLTGQDPKSSAVYGAFNGAAASLMSGGGVKGALLSAGSGALGSGQVAGLFGSNVAHTGAMIGYQAGSGLANGQSLEAVGVGALTSAGSYGVGWVGSRVSSTVSEALRDTFSKKDASTALNNPDLPEKVAQDPTFSDGAGATLDAAINGMVAADAALTPTHGEPDPSPAETPGGA